MRKRIYEIVQRAQPGDDLSRAYDIFIVVVAFISLIPLMFREWNPWLVGLDVVTVYILFLDYILRWITQDFKTGEKGWKAFAKYPFTPLALLELVSLLPSLGVLPETFRFLRVLRIVNIFRYSKNLMLVGNVFSSERKTLLSVLMLAIAYIFVSGLIMFTNEPETFGTFFNALYWATTALTTVGYGDMYPRTDLGRFISMVSSLFGIAVIALPAGIITGGFLEQIRKSEEDRAKYFNRGKRDRFNGKPLRAYASVKEYAQAHPKVLYYSKVMASCIILNVVLYEIVAYMDLPVWLNTVGTALAAFMLEPAAGLLVGFVNNLVLAIQFQNAGEILFYAVSAIAALVYGILFARGKKLTARTLGLAAFYLVIVSAFVSTLLTYAQGLEAPLLAGDMPYWSVLVDAGVPGPIACFLAIVLDKAIDAVATFALVMLIVRFIKPREFPVASKVGCPQSEGEKEVQVAGVTSLSSVIEGELSVSRSEQSTRVCDDKVASPDAQPRATFVVGIDVGGTTTKFGIFARSGELINKYSFVSTPVLADGTFVHLTEQFTAALAANSVAPSQVIAVGLAVPGPAASENDFVVCPNLDLDLRAYKSFLNAEFPKASIAVINDADAAVLGDSWQGSASKRACENFILVTLGTGLGTGIILRGELLTSGKGAVGEIGHLCVEPTDGIACGCGRSGCLEQYVSSRALVRMAREFAQADIEAQGGLAGENTIGQTNIAAKYADAQAVFAAATDGDKAALKAVNRFADKLAFGLSQIGCMIDPEMIVLGGGMAASSDVYMGELKTRYKAYAFDACRSTEIVASELGNDCGIYGAALRALEKVDGK